MSEIVINPDFVKVMGALKDAERGRLFTAMCRYALTGEDAELVGNERILYPAAKMMIDANRKETENEKERTKEKEKEKEKTLSKKGTKFIPPTLAEVKERIEEMGYRYVNAESFMAHYQSVGWKVGKNKMESWHAALAGWESRATVHVKDSQGTKKNPALRYEQTPISETDWNNMTVDLD